MNKIKKVEGGVHIYIYISLIVAICRRVEYRRIKRREGEEELSLPRATPPLFFLFRRFHRRRSNGCLRVARGEQFPSETYCFPRERGEEEARSRFILPPREF